MYLLIQINVVFLYAGLPTPVLGLFSGPEPDLARDLIRAWCSEQQLGHCYPLADLTPLIATLGFSPDHVPPSWARLLTLAPMIRNAPADTD